MTMNIEKLLEEASEKGTLVGRGVSMKGAHMAVFEYNGRYFAGGYLDNTYEYICGAEEITKDDIKKYINV